MSGFRGQTAVIFRRKRNARRSCSDAVEINCFRSREGTFSLAASALGVPVGVGDGDVLGCGCFFVYWFRCAPSGGVKRRFPAALATTRQKLHRIRDGNGFFTSLRKARA
jgi:hypothetical protein